WRDCIGRREGQRLRACGRLARCLSAEPILPARPTASSVTMDIEHFDAIIVGAGQAGPAIAARCSREGLKTAVIERHHFGGTCVNVGCVPTKTLVASARAIR